MIDKQPAPADEHYKSNVFFIRGQSVMLSMHLAEAYEIGPEVLVQTVERSIECFPENSVFQLNPEEIADLKSQHAISSPAETYAFTGQGASMLSGILFDERAMHENQEICAPTCSCRK